MRSVHARAVGIKEQLTIVWGFRPLAEGLLYMMSRVVDVVEGEGEGAKSCADKKVFFSQFFVTFLSNPIFSKLPFFVSTLRKGSADA